MAPSARWDISGCFRKCRSDAPASETGRYESGGFWKRGKAGRFNNETKEGGAYESTYSEMNWESMDGSSLLGILFANWYNNGAEIPVEEEAAKAYWRSA